MRLLRKLRSATPIPSVANPASPYTLEVVVQWGSHSILHVDHSSPPRAFHVGDAGAAGDAADAPAIDFALDRGSLGADRLPLILVDGDEVRVVVPAGARAQLQLPDCCVGDAELAAQGKLPGLPELPGARAFVLPPGASARVALGELGFVFTLGMHEDAGALAPSRDVDWKGQRWTAASLVFHLGGLLLFMLLPPANSALALTEVDSRSHLVNFVIDGRTQPPPTPSWDSGLQGGSESGERANGESGTAGTPDESVQPQRGAARGHAPRPMIPRETAAPDPATAGILGILRGAQLSAPMAFTGERAEGDALQDVMGGLVGPTIGATFGTFGGGMIGSGRGGGGNASGTVGSGGLATIGNGGLGGTGTGYGVGAGSFHDRAIRVPHIKVLPPDVRGSLSKETIRRVIHLHLAEVRACYEQRLIARPDLQGRLAVRFVIAPTGMVQVAVAQGSELHDAIAEQCIVGAVRRWTFPQPEGGGIVSVSYPFMLQQM